MTDNRKNLLHPTDEVMVLKSKENDTKVLSNDRALNSACEGVDWHTITPEMMQEFCRSFEACMGRINKDFPALIAKCDHQTRLAITCQVFHALVEHAKEGGSFRHLIYNRLGFGEHDYMPLHLAGGTAISNEFDLSNYDENAALRETMKKLGINIDEIVAKGEPGVYPRKEKQ